MSRSELQSAFQAYERTVHESFSAADWGAYSRLFTEDAVLNDHLYGEFCGRAEITTFAEKSMGVFPGREFSHFASDWEVYDDKRAWVVTHRSVILRDPGDGSVFGAPSVAVLKYAGDGLWSEVEQIYNPELFSRMLSRYLKRCHALGTLSAEGREWAEWADIGLDPRHDPTAPDIADAP